MVYETERNYTMKGKKMETGSKNEIGKISLWVAIAGVVGPAALALLFILLAALTKAQCTSYIWTKSQLFILAIPCISPV